MCICSIDQRRKERERDEVMTEREHNKRDKDNLPEEIDERERGEIKFIDGCEKNRRKRERQWV